MAVKIGTTGIRALLILTLLIAAAALVLDFRYDQSLQAAAAHGRERDRDVTSVQIGLADWRSAQIAYLAEGQDLDRWSGRAGELSASVAATLERLRASSESPAAVHHYEAATAALVDIRKFDGKARDHVSKGQRLVAADALMVDGVEPYERIGTEVAAAKQAEADAGTAAATRVSQLRLGVNAAALLAVAGIACLFGLPAKQPGASDAAVMAQMLRELPPPVKPKIPVVRPAPSAQPATASVNLPDAAEVCLDLARVADPRDMPPLLERVAAVLDARGVIVWISDAEGAVLSPVLTFGYSDRILAKLGTLTADAENVTSLAFRTMRPQTMAGADATASGAIAVPIITVDGCSGVLAAEIRDSKATGDVLALARIMAAQLGTLVAPSEAARATGTT